MSNTPESDTRFTRATTQEGFKIIGRRILLSRDESRLEGVYPIPTSYLRKLFAATIENPHPNLGRLFGCFYDVKPWFIHEYYYLEEDAIPLGEALQDEQTRQYIKDNLRTLVGGFLSGVRHLHEYGVLHKDLKIDNTLFSIQDGLVITDFKLMGLVNEENRLPGFGTHVKGPREIFLYSEAKRGLVLDERTDVLLASVEVADLLLKLAEPERSIAVLNDDRNMSMRAERVLGERYGEGVTEALKGGIRTSVSDRYRTIDELMKELLPCL